MPKQGSRSRCRTMSSAIWEVVGGRGSMRMRSGGKNVYVKAFPLISERSPSLKLKPLHNIHEEVHYIIYVLKRCKDDSTKD